MQINFHLIIFSFFLTILFFSVQNADAASDYFLKIEGVDGESTDSKHKNEIDVESWSWGATNSGAAFGSGLGTGKATLQDFHFTKNLDKSSPNLFLAVATGNQFTKATFTARSVGENPLEYLIVTLEKIRVTSYQIGGSQDVLPVDTMSLNFEKISVKYTPRDETGRPLASIIGSYDLLTNSGDIDADGDGVPAGTGILDDCDDNDPTNFPGNLEVQDGKDNNCDVVVDEEVTIRGTFNTVWGSVGPGVPADHPHEPLYLLMDGTNVFELTGVQDVAEQFGGPFNFLKKEVDVTGLLFTDGTLEVRLLEEPVEGPFSHILGSHVSGSQKWATLLCRFGDSTGVTPQPISYFTGLMSFMDDYWREVSYENINLVGSTEEDWVNMVDPRADYFDGDGDADLVKLGVDCMNAADSSVNYPDFDGVNFMYNEDLDCCSWGGSLTIDIDGEVKTYSTTWMATWGWENQDVLGQEMGHGFGLPHSSGPYGATYDSQWDVMSSGGNCVSTDPDYGCRGVHVVSPYKDALGWIDGAERYVDDNTSDQYVFINRLALPTGPGVLEAQIPLGDDEHFYSIEARKFSGFDGLGQIPGEAILIHKVDETLEDSNAQVVDDSDNDDPNDAGAMWAPGELFVDDVNNVKVAIVDMTEAGFNIIIRPTVADLSVEKTGPPDPVVAGTQITYTVTVNNNGPDNAENVIVVDTLHPDLVHISNTGGCVVGLANTLTCNLGNIANGGSDSFDITVEIPADYVYNGGTVVGNEAEASSNQFDDDTSNNDDAVVNDVIAETDIEILSFTKTETPAEVLLGDSFDVTVTKIITNNGVSSPVDVSALIEASGDGVSIAPPQALPGVVGLEIGEEAEMVEDFAITCEEPGTHEVTVSNEIMPNNAVDPDLSNNNAEVVIEVECIIPVKINIHPGSLPNPINLKNKNGVVPLAILSTSEGEFGLPVAIDATMINPLSVNFGPTDLLFNVEPPGGAKEFHNKGHPEDSFEPNESTKDGDIDMVLHFKATESGLESTDTEACTKGQINIGGMMFTFFGCDSFVSKP